MRRRRLAFHTAWIGLLFLAVAGATVAFEGPVPVPDGSTLNDPGAAPALPPATDDFTPAACRRAPECSVDADCLAICGPTGGHCVHSNCPVRICKCR